MRVFIIDDSRLSVSALQSILGGMGHEIVGTAFSGEEGVTKSKSVRPDVVCLDMVMPGIDGKETAINLRNDNPAVKIVMITQNEIGDSLKSEIKAVSYMRKPITKSKLEEAFASI